MKKIMSWVWVIVCGVMAGIAVVETLGGIFKCLFRSSKDIYNPIVWLFLSVVFYLDFFSELWDLKKENNPAREIKNKNQFLLVSTMSLCIGFTNSIPVVVYSTIIAVLVYTFFNGKSHNL